MLILIFLINFSKSIKSFSSPGYYSIELNRNEQLEVSLNQGKYDCIFIWSHAADNDATITVFKNNKSKDYNLIGETTAIVKGDKALISISAKTTVHTWIIKKDICNMHSILYTTPHFIKDNFKVKNEVDNLCLFFSNHNNQSKISFISQQIKESEINVYSENSPETTIFSNSKYLSKQFNVHFFMHITNPTGIMNLNFEVIGDEPKNLYCDHLPIHMITIDGETEKEVIADSEISCIDKNDKNTSIIPFILILVFIISIIISSGIIYQTGYYKRIIAWWKGELIKDGPAKIEIDPKDLLRIDDIEDDEIENLKNDQESTNNNNNEEKNNGHNMNDDEKSKEYKKKKTDL